MYSFMPLCYAPAINGNSVSVPGPGQACGWELTIFRCGMVLDLLSGLRVGSLSCMHRLHRFVLLSDICVVP